MPCMSTLGIFSYSCIHHYCKINQMWTKKATWMTQKLRFELPKQAVKQFLLVRVIVRKITVINFISSKFLKDLEIWLLECRVYRTICSLIIHRYKLPSYWKYTKILRRNKFAIIFKGKGITCICFYCKTELMYTNRPLCHNKITSTYYLCFWWLFSLKLKLGIFILKIITDGYKYPNRKASKSPYIQHFCEHLFQEFIYKIGIIPSVLWIAFPSTACASFSVSFVFLVLQPGMEPTPPAVEVWSLNYCTTR